MIFGVRLAMLHPRVAGRSCEQCKKWLYNEDGRPTMRGRGEEAVHLPRLPQDPTPCWKCPKVPQGARAVPASAVELTPRLWKAYDHYLCCRAVGSFPDDHWVRQNASLIRAVEDAAGPMRQSMMLESMVALLAGGR